MGKKAEEAVELMLRHYDLLDTVSVKQYLDEAEAILIPMFLVANAMPGAERLVRHLVKHGKFF